MVLQMYNSGEFKTQVILYIFIYASEDPHD